MTLPSSPWRLAIVGRGRLGTALAAALRRAGHDVSGPLGLGYDPADLRSARAVLLCVPDEQIAAAASVLAERLPAGPPEDVLVGHCSGATGLEVLAPFTGFSLHPLIAVARGDDGGAWGGAAAAVAAGEPGALEFATRLARDLGLEPVTVAEGDRAAYHAAASMASNFLVTLECAAAELAETAGLERGALLPLVRRTVENWGRDGAAALTGPIARGDETTVERQRAAVAERAPELLSAFDALAGATRRLAAHTAAEAVAA